MNNFQNAVTQAVLDNARALDHVKEQSNNLASFSQFLTQSTATVATACARTSKRSNELKSSLRALNDAARGIATAVDIVAKIKVQCQESEKLLLTSKELEYATEVKHARKRADSAAASRAAAAVHKAAAAEAAFRDEYNGAVALTRARLLARGEDDLVVEVAHPSASYLPQSLAQYVPTSQPNPFANPKLGTGTPSSRKNSLLSRTATPPPKPQSTPLPPAPAWYGTTPS